jgi:transcriptional regulator with XRE-family HTH domain
MWTVHSNLKLVENMDMPKQKRKGTDQLPFGKILTQIMKDRNLSITAVAEMAGVSRSVVQSWTARANPHDLQAVAKLAKALNINFKELLLGETDQESVKTLNDIFEEKDFFEGICKINIQRLVPKKGK